ncbi:hypothetical protein [Hyphomicrobium sp.]|nr:hypothetical protein [Hyphomicrobium sp.]MBY0558561.1 hypothetical protein [Hyphomicrobium sp.]
MASLNNGEIFDAILRQDLASFIAKAFATVDGSQPFTPNWHMTLSRIG